MLKLAQLAHNVQRQARSLSSTIVGVVTDVTRPLYREKQGNYIVMIKIVDESLNDQQMFGVMSKDCTVYLISKNRKEIQFVKAIGEILLLDKFTFSLWNDIKLETKYLHMSQGIYQVAIDPLSGNLGIKNSLSMVPELLEVTPIMTERVKFLMEWRSTCLPKIYEPKLGISILNSHCVMVEPFNMILRFEGKANQSQKMFILMLKDINNNVFKVRFHEDGFEPGDLVLIRGIGSIGQSLELRLTETGNVLRFTYQVNPNLMNYMAIHRDNQKFVTGQKQNAFTIINSESIEPTFLADLIELQEKYNFTSRKEDVEVRDTYLINAFVVNYEGVLSFYHREYQVLLHDGFYSELPQDQKKEYKEANRMAYVYEGVLGLFDRSNESKGKPFYIHLFTSDVSGNFMGVQEFAKAEKAIGTGQESIARKELENNIKKKLKYLAVETSFAKPASLLLEPIRSQKLLFRLINTKIL